MKATESPSDGIDRRPKTGGKRRSGTAKKRERAQSTGRLRIGDDWRAITIIALSQSNPLKALAEFVENSIDAGAKHVHITRGRERKEHYVRITDDGQGIPRDEDGKPNFKYVATHVCDSIKRRLKADGATGIQGEFGIGLLSFWTVGEVLTLVSSSADGKTYEMRMRKGDPSYTVNDTRRLFAEAGTELTVKPLLPGLRQMSGDKIQRYLASELRDRIRQSGVEIKITDRQARKEYAVEPRRFTGRLLHELEAGPAAQGEVYLELYLAPPDADHQVGLYRAGTRVIERLSELEAFQHPPWTEDCLQGIVDAPFLTLTPGTRSGVIQDEAFTRFVAALAPVEAALNGLIEAQRTAEDERESEQLLRTLRKAFREALLTLPAEEYDWFDIHARRAGAADAPDDKNPGLSVDARDREDGAASKPKQKAFFDYPGPLFSVRIQPASSVLRVNESKTLRAVPTDRARRLVESNVGFTWSVAEGDGRLDNTDGEIVTFHAPAEPGIARIAVCATQHGSRCTGEAVITVTDSLVDADRSTSTHKQGLPSYTFQHAPGELWRSRYDAENNVIVINNGHRDFVFAAKARALKLRYIARLFAKEMVFKNFPGLGTEQLLERLIELSLYTEENLR